MLNIRLCRIVAAIVCAVALGAQISFARGPAGNHHSGGNNSQSAFPTWANSWPYLRAENGVFGPVWAAPGPGSIGFGGYGVGGYGAGGCVIGGWGYGVDGSVYDLPGVPYFPSTRRSSTATLTGRSCPMQLFNPQLGRSDDSHGLPNCLAPSASAPRPLRIANPYYNARNDLD